MHRGSALRTDLRSIAGSPLGRPGAKLLVLSYLNRPEAAAPRGEWISEKDLTGGSLFFRGAHTLPVQDLERRFGTDRESFRKASERLGGTPLSFGDASYAFAVLPELPAACILSLSDEEFSARVTMMFDHAIDRRLPLDVVLALTHCVGRALLSESRPG